MRVIETHEGDNQWVETKDMGRDKTATKTKTHVAYNHKTTPLCGLFYMLCAK